MRLASISARTWLGLLTVALVLLALARPLDHDESQYVAAAALAAHGQLPYRDFAYLQTPLQPLLFAPVAWAAGALTWPALRILNALLGVVTVALVYRAAREAGAEQRPALLSAALFASCDILLFSIGTARNDALPAALLTGALWPILRAAKGSATPASAALTGFLLAAAAAAKISYALPAIAYGLYALLNRKHRPLWIAAGALPIAALVGWTFALAPLAFRFGVFDFPALAPGEYYRATGRLWKLDWGTKLIDILKFLALGPALLAALLATRFRWRPKTGQAIDWVIWAGLLAAVLPFPTWRQYLLPILPPLFVRLAMGWHIRPPGMRARIASTVFACAGLAPSVVALASALPTIPMIDAMQQGAAIGRAMNAAGVTGPIETLSPQFLPAAGRLPDLRYATGPFYFRSHGLLDSQSEAADHVVSRDRFAERQVAPGAAILVGGEVAWTSGDRSLDDILERWARQHGWRYVPVEGGRFRLYVRPR